MSDLLSKISLQLTRVGLPLIICASLIGNGFNIAILGQHQMRKHACSLYFIALSINNLIYSSSILILSLMGDGYQIRISSSSTVSCKLITYFGTVFSGLAQFFIVLASIDRWCASSSIVQRRNVSNVRTAKFLIFIITLFISCLFIISLVTSDISSNDALGCRVRGDPIFVQVYGIFQFIVFSCLAPLLMLIFGCMTIFNIKQHRNIVLAQTPHRRTEAQLIRMLLVQVGVQLVLVLPLCVVGLLLSFPGIYQPTPSFYSIFFICRVIFQMSYATPFFLYILSARVFRKQFIDLIFKIFRCLPWHRTQFTRRNGTQTTAFVNTVHIESIL